MKKRYLLAYCLVVVLVVSAFAACNNGAPADTGDAAPPAAGSADTGSAAPAGDGPTGSDVIIGYNAYGDTVDFSRVVWESFEPLAEAEGWTVLYGTSNGDAATSLANANSFVTQGAQILIDFSWGESPCRAAADVCIDAGIPIIVSDVILDTTEPLIYYQGVSHTEIGQTLGNAAADFADANWDGDVDGVLLEYPDKAGETGRPRCGMIPVTLNERGIEVTDDEIQWVSPDTNDATLAAKNFATDYLTAHPDKHHIVMAGQNEQGTAGLAAGVEAAGRSDDVIVMSCDTASLGVENLFREDPTCWIGSANYFPEDYGAPLVDMVKRILAGEDIEKEWYVDVIYMDRNNVAEYYDNPNA